MANTTQAEYNSYLERAYTLSGAEDAENLYNDWAKSYDTDLNAGEYLSPQAAVDAVVRECSSSDTAKLTILDAGCGTGLVGEYFAKSKLADRFVIDGLDLTQGMLDVAKVKGVYRDLEVADLTKAIARSDGSYDVVTCIGTLTKGHVGPAVLGQFARVTAKGGIIVASIHNDIWESMKYKSTVEELQDAGVVEVVSTEGFDMFKNANERGRLVVLRKK